MMISAARTPVSIFDSFDRADSSTALGTTSDGNAVWTTTVFGGWGAGGLWGIDSNQAYYVSAVSPGPLAAGGLAFIDCLLPDGTVTVTINNYGSALGVGPGFRWSEDGGFGFHLTDEGLNRTDSNFATQIASWTPLYGTEPVRLRVDFSGSSIVVTNVTTSTVLASVTDSHYLTNTRHGMVTASTASRFNDWAYDLP